MFSMDRYLNLYSHCKVVKGRDESVIVDFKNKRINYIPNDMADIIIDNKNISLNQDKLMNRYGADNKDAISSYLYGLEKKDIVFQSKNELDLGEFNTEYLKPTHLELMTLEIDSDNLCFDYLNIISEFESMGGVKMEIRFKNSSTKNIKILEDILSQHKYSRIKFFSCHITRDDKLLSKMVKLLTYYIKFRILYVKEEKRSKPKKELYCNNRNVLFFYNETNDIKKHFRTHYIINRHFFTESLKYNVYLNKKISISSKGEIKNSFEFKTVHGLIQDEKTLSNVLKMKSITSLWEVNNDKILDLKHLPIRYCIINPFEIKITNQNEYEIVY